MGPKVSTIGFVGLPRCDKSAARAFLRGRGLCADLVSALSRTPHILRCVGCRGLLDTQSGFENNQFPKRNPRASLKKTNQLGEKRSGD
jgi:hypothetical protein